MHPVESTHLAAIGYDEEASVLRVQFMTGDIWEYANVIPAVFGVLRSHHSPGSFFANTVRPNYAGVKVHDGTLQDRADIWLRTTGVEYAGMWVALFGSPARVAGYADTEAEARAAGGEDCVVVKVPGKEN